MSEETAFTHSFRKSATLYSIADDVLEDYLIFDQK